MLKKKGFWIIFIIIVALSGGGFAYYHYNYSPAQSTTDTPVQTAVVRRGNLFISASGIGDIIAASELSLGFGSSGVVGEIDAKVGDKVKAGDVLAKLGNLSDLEQSVSSAQLDVTNAQITLQDLQDSWEMDKANAQLAVFDAQQALTDAQTARVNLNYPRCNQDYIDNYYAKYLDSVKQVNNLKKRNASFDSISAAETTRDGYLATYNYCTSPRTDTEIGTADANVAVAQATLDDAQRLLDKIQDGPDAQQVALDQAQLSLAESQLKIAQENLEKATLVSPIDGTIMTISAQVGETAGTSDFITIADLDNPTLEIYLDETDMDMAGMGYEVDVVFDALPDQTFIGSITQVDPALTSSGNVNTVRAIVELDPSSFSKPQTLPVGLTASVDVIGSKAENVLLVPVEALHEIDADTYGVFVMENGAPKLYVVTVGLMDYTYAEITSGLQEGDVVTTGIVETQG